MDKKKTITRNACAKINLGLDVVGVRGDGYHLLRMIMQQIDLFDTLTFTVTEAQGSGEIRLIDESGLSPVGEDNLICRAIRMMKEQYDLHADVEVLGVDRESNGLITDVGHLNLVLRIVNLEREVTIDIGNTMGNNTTVVVDFYDIRHHQRLYVIRHRTRNNVASLRCLRHRQGTEAHKEHEQ